MRTPIQITSQRTRAQEVAIIDETLYPHNTNAAVGAVLMALHRVPEGGLAQRGAVLMAIERHYPQDGGMINLSRAERICDALSRTS